jgi:hypothetical protein
LRGQVVTAGGQQRHDEAALIAARGHALEAGAQVDDADQGAGNVSPALVEHRAAERRGRSLGADDRRDNEQADERHREIRTRPYSHTLAVKNERIFCSPNRALAITLSGYFDPTTLADRHVSEVDDSAAQRDRHRLRAVNGSQLLHDVLDVDFDGLLRDEKSLGDVPIAVSSAHVFENGPLALRQ